MNREQDFYRVPRRFCKIPFRGALGLLNNVHQTKILLATARVLWFKRGEGITLMLSALVVPLFVLLLNFDLRVQTHSYESKTIRLIAGTPAGMSMMRMRA